MADNATKIVLTAEDRTQGAFQSVERGLGGMQRQALETASALSAIGFTAAAASAVAFVRSIANAADDMAKLSQRVGISVRDLAQWQLAADLSGASIESVAKGVKGLATFLKEHGDRLKAVGITTNDASSAMMQLADIFAAMPDGLQKTALATELFGKAGLDMIPMLNSGSKGLEELRAKADEYGKSMAEIAPESERFNDALTELGLQSKIAGANLAEYLLPGLSGMAQWFNDAAAGGKRAEQALKFLEDSNSPLMRGAAALHRLFRPDEFAANGWAMAGMDPATGRSLGAGGGDTSAPSAAQTAAEAKARTLLGSAAKSSKAGKPDFGIAPGSGSFNGSAGWKAWAADQERQFKETEATIARLIGMTTQGKLQTLAGEQDLAAQLLGDGRISFEGYEEILDKLGGIKEKGIDTFAELKKAVESWGNKAADTFADFVVTGKASFSDLFNSIAGDIVRMQAKKMFDPLVSAGGDWVTKILGSVFGNADGGVYASGDLHQHVNSIVAQPTVFKFAKGGNFGMMGEAGPEAIMPLSRGTDGKLGVKAQGGGGVVVNVVEAPGQGGQTRQRQEGGLTIVDVMVDRVRSALANDITRGTGPVPGALAGAYGLNRVAGAY